MTKALDGGGHLIDIGLAHGLGRLHHAHDAVILTPHDAVVAGGIGKHGREQSGRRPRVTVVAHQRRQRRGPYQRGVARKDHHVTVGIDQALGQTGDAHSHGIAGSELFRLFHEVDGQRRRRVIDQCLGDPFAPVADDDDDLLGRQLGQSVEDVENHRPPAQTVQGLRTRRAHPCPFAGGEHHGRQRTVGHAV
jgi:hypothetical protein